MRSPFKFVLIYLAAGACLFSCSAGDAGGPEDTEGYRRQLQQQEEFIVEIAREKTRINDLVNDVLLEKDELMTEEALTKMEADEKISGILEVIERGERRINSLEKELAQQGSRAMGELVSPDLEALRTRLANLGIELNRLRSIIAEKDNEIVNLKDENRKLLAVIETKDTEINSLEAEKNRLRTEIDALETQKQEMAARQEQAREELAIEYYNMGIEWKEAAEEVRGLTGKKRKRSEYVLKAIIYFEKAEELGNPVAGEVLDLLKNSKYYQDEE